MKLWYCIANAYDYQPYGIVEAKTEDEARQKFEDKLGGICITSTYVEEIKE
jgi:hypothetical protein